MGKLADIISRLKNVKHIQIIACGAALAVVLTVYFSCVSCSNESKSVGGVYTDVGVSSDYCSTMRGQVEKIVSEISGVGSASVVINWDRTVSSTGFGGGSTENPQAVSALIVCDGGNSTKVKLDVIYAVSTLLDLSIEKIMVYPKSI